MELDERTPTAKAPAERFTGDVYLNILHAPREPSRLSAALVRFPPGARTNWHSHALGRTLHCTAGEGLVVTRDGTIILSAAWLEPPITTDQDRNLGARSPESTPTPRVPDMATR